MSVAEHLEMSRLVQKFKKLMQIVNSFSEDGVYFALSNLCAPES